MHGLRIAKTLFFAVGIHHLSAFIGQHRVDRRYNCNIRPEIAVVTDRDLGPCKVIREITEADSMKYKPEILADNRVIEADEK